MKKKDRELIKKGFKLFKFYVRGRVIARISYGFIGAGVSVLGFGNFIPYLTVIIRPELTDKIPTQNNWLVVIGILLIIIGAILPLFSKIFNHYRDIYINDLKRVNKIYDIYDIDTFNFHIDRIANSVSIFEYEIDQIETLYYLILKSDFYFNDKKTNEIVKRLGNELNDFDNEMSLRVFPAGGNSKLYIAAKNLGNYQQIKTDVKIDCEKLKNSYQEMKNCFDDLQNRKIMRFFK